MVSNADAKLYWFYWSIDSIYSIDAIDYMGSRCFWGFDNCLKNNIYLLLSTRNAPARLGHTLKNVLVNLTPYDL